ncbi:MgtC/SapB family protein [Marinospirillum sp.]|uniref:MgtC/SapB family protein n=1 Tax=Marinospirillum sp. TaxID=2183934 RepID=UPI00286FFB03|nr:MgtC/SapB family protein [Marinospirillum sp.]MDR9466664.1 MgtC/SapB family protein [Marinospirillum sp.]
MGDLTQKLISDNQVLINLGIALLLGALIGLQRGWVARDRKSGERIAGIRTFALVGLLGGVAALLTKQLTLWAFPVVFVGVMAVSLAAYLAKARKIEDYSITSLVGLILTFCYGALALAYDPTLAAACAVITTIILDNKEEIHGWLHRLYAHELDAGLKLLLITVVLLPLLPNRDMGPGGALNPYEIWWLVVLIASVSFVGYFAVRVGGAEKGILFTGLFAGLSSSTALTLHFARQSRHATQLSSLLAVGILLACGTMFPRILLYALVINPALLESLWLPVLVMTLLLYIPAFMIWRTSRRSLAIEQPTLSQNPLDLTSALVFGALLTGILVLGEWLRGALGDAGIYLLAASSGVADVDAITLSLTRMAQGRIEESTAVIAIVLAASVNNAIKAGMAVFLGTSTLGWKVALPMGISLLAGLAVAWLV